MTPAPNEPSPVFLTRAPSLGPDSDDLGIYVHWPFCQHRCGYCAFNTMVPRTPNDTDVDLWQEALFQQLSWWRNRLGPRHLDTMFFGGGTPSLMPPLLVQDTINHCLHLWPPRPRHHVEITLEVNPTADKTLQELSKTGVNRISVGVQSLNDNALTFLTRQHSAQEARTTVQTAQQLFEQVSVDLIYARPRQQVGPWRKELHDVMEQLAPTHLSLYQLTIKPGTPFAQAVQRGVFHPLDADRETSLYLHTLDHLESRGLSRYEVSNFAAPGAMCRHNRRYWLGRCVIGVGPGAHGRWHQDGLIWESVGIMHPLRWRKAAGSGDNACTHIQPLSWQQVLDETILTGLRLTEGLSRKRLDPLLERTGMTDSFHQRATHLATTGDLLFNPQTLRLTRQGTLRLDSVATYLLA